MNLIDRDFVLVLGSKRIAMRDSQGKDSTVLRCDFEVERKLKKAPNSVKVTVYNLSEQSRFELSQQELLQIIIEAGYVDYRHEIFKGEVTFAKSVLVGNDWVTEFQAGDSVKAFQGKRINTSLKGPVKVGDVLQTAATALGVGTGNVGEKLGGLREGFKNFTQGVVLSGRAETHLSKITKSMGYDWSIQSGQMTILGPKEYIGTTAYKLSRGTGLIGTPEPGEKGLVKARALIIPDFAPGRPVQLDSLNTKGLFRIDAVKFLGSTYGNDWYADLELRSVA